MERRALERVEHSREWGKGQFLMGLGVEGGSHLCCQPPRGAVGDPLASGLQAHLKKGQDVHLSEGWMPVGLQAGVSGTDSCKPPAEMAAATAPMRVTSGNGLGQQCLKIHRAVTSQPTGLLK